MPRSTARFLAQHAELGRLASEMMKLLDARALAADPSTARRALATFAGRLRIHSAMENEALYPRLLACGDPAIERKARELFDSFAGLYEEVSAHTRRWTEPDAIQQQPQVFVDQTRSLLTRLGQRIARENAELYPLADRLEA